MAGDVLIFCLWCEAQTPEFILADPYIFHIVFDPDLFHLFVVWGHLSVFFIFYFIPPSPE